MKFFKIFAILCILCLSMNTCMAMTLGSGVSQLKYFDASTTVKPQDMVYDYNNERIIYLDTTNDKICEFIPAFPTTEASTSTIAYNATQVTSISLTTDGKLVYTDSSNNIKIMPSLTGMYDFSDSDVIDTFEQVAQLAYTPCDIAIDGNDNFYVGTTNGKLYKVSQPTYAISQLTVPTTRSNALETHVDIHPDGLLISLVTDVAASKIYLYDLGENSCTELYNFGSYTTPFTHRTQCLVNGDIIVLYSVTGTDYLKYYNYTTDSLTLSIFEDGGAPDYADVCIDGDGLIYVSETGGGFELYDIGNNLGSLPYASGIYTATADGGSSIFEYVNKDVTSVYTTYYNNSDISINYNIKTDLLEYSSTDDACIAEVFKNNYAFRIDLINPDGVPEQTYNIDNSQLKEDLQIVTESFFGIPIPTGKAKQYSTTSNIKFNNNNNWHNGTWEVKLYEYNINSSVSTTLASDTFDILNQQTSTNINIDDSDKTIDGTTLAENVLISPYFFALIIIMAIALTSGTIAGGTGFIGGATIGVFISGGFGLIPMWLIITLIIVFAVLFALIGGNALGGGD